MNAVAIGSAVIKLLPVVVDTIRQIEEMDSSSGKGNQKLALAVNIIRGIYEAADPNPAIPFDQLVGALQKIIAALVEFYNSVGVFKKALQQQAA